MQLTHRLRSLYHTGVVVVHTIDVGPDLDLFRAQGGSYQASRVVGTAALKVINLAHSVATDKALRDIQVVMLVGGKECLQLFLDKVSIGFALLINSHIVKGGQQENLHALF